MNKVIWDETVDGPLFDEELFEDGIRAGYHYAARMADRAGHSEFAAQLRETMKEPHAIPPEELAAAKERHLKRMGP